MSGFILSMQGAISQGVLWGIMVLGVYITFRILDIADLTVDGSFALGGCICAMLMLNKGMNPILALLCATLAGAAAGAVTGILHTVFEIPAILAGILTQISLWSVNLRIMGQKSNLPLLNTESIFTWIGGCNRNETVDGFFAGGCGDCRFSYLAAVLVLRNRDWRRPSCHRR